MRSASLAPIACRNAIVTGSLDTGADQVFNVIGAATPPTGRNSPPAPARSGCGSENAPLTSLPVAVSLGSATDSSALPAVEMTLAVVEAEYSRATPGVKGPNEAGAPSVALCGNLKFDVQPPQALVARGRQWREALGRPVVLAAITRDGEEAELLREWGRATGRSPFLIVVPRHPQRFDEVEALMRGNGLRMARRSAWNEMPDAAQLQVDAWLGDSLGEMPLYYGAADVALLGGSFMPFGGHNLIEAAACACPIVIGPSTYNFAEAAKQAVASGKSLDELLHETPARKP